MLQPARVVASHIVHQVPGTGSVHGAEALGDRPISVVSDIRLEIVVCRIDLGQGRLHGHGGGFAPLQCRDEGASSLPASHGPQVTMLEKRGFTMCT